METHDTDNFCCGLCEDSSGQSLEKIRESLWRNVWYYMSPSKAPPVLRDASPEQNFLWMLVSCAFTGCMKTFRFLLQAYSNEESVAGTDQGDSHSVYSASLKVRHLVNQRLVCDFPLPDSWLHQPLRLALSPLHLACWRHDFTMVQTLLSLGAEPNDLALELMDFKDTSRLVINVPFRSAYYGRRSTSSNLNGDSSEQDHSGLADKNCTNYSPCIHGTDVDGNEEYGQFSSDQGVSPLVFLAHGVRSPPAQLLKRTSEEYVIHDVLNNFYLHKQGMYPYHDTRNGCQSMLKDCSVGRCSSSGAKINKKCMDDTELLKACFDVLISAGADPNQGSSRCFESAFPLDLLIQPPLCLFHTSNLSRCSELSVCYRRCNLQSNLSGVVISCRAMLFHCAQLSPKFSSVYRWRPHLLDCFTVDHSELAVELVKIVTCLGLFDDRECVNWNLGTLNTFRSNQDVSPSKNRRMETLVAGVISNGVPKEFMYAFFQCLPITTLQLFNRVSTWIIDRSDFEHQYLTELIPFLKDIQLRSLFQSTMLTVIQQTHGNTRKRRHFESIDLLPLPNPLKKQLLYLSF